MNWITILFGSSNCCQRRPTRLLDHWLEKLEDTGVIIKADDLRQFVVKILIPLYKGELACTREMVYSTWDSLFGFCLGLWASDLVNLLLETVVGRHWTFKVYCRRPAPAADLGLVFYDTQNVFCTDTADLLTLCITQYTVKLYKSLVYLLVSNVRIPPSITYCGWVSIVLYKFSVTILKLC